KEHENIVALLGLGFRRRAGVQVNQVDVVHGNVGVVFLSPLNGKFLVEPFIERGNKVAPLQNLERLLLGGGPFRKQECRPQRSSGNTAGPGNLDEISSRYTLALLLFLHKSLLSSLCDSLRSPT